MSQIMRTRPVALMPKNSAKNAFLNELLRKSYSDSAPTASRIVASLGQCGSYGQKK